MVKDLASYQHCNDRINKTWVSFTRKREERMAQQVRLGVAAEKVAEDILEDLFTEVLDWTLADLNNQLEYADIVLTRLDVKYLLIEVKRPGSLAWNRKGIEAALNQAWGYADKQKVKRIAISDGVMLYAADVEHGALRDRVFADLQSEEPQEDLWWLSVHGIYRDRAEAGEAGLRLLPETEVLGPAAATCANAALLHPKYRLPASCFAFVGHAADPSTWKLPYLTADGEVDAKRLPKAIAAILSNYRGTKVSGIPDRDIPDVLLHLADAAASLGKMPSQSGETAVVYQQLAEALDQLRGRSEGH
jgi:hypothetical protein